MTECKGAARRPERRDWRLRPAVVNVLLIAAGWSLLALMSNGAPLPALALATGLVLLGAGVASATVGAVWFLRARLRRSRSRRGRAPGLRRRAAGRLGP